MLKVHILVPCSHCNGEAYLPVSEAEDCQAHVYVRHRPCPVCEGSGSEPKWIALDDFAKQLQQAICPHEHTTYQGSMHFSAGDVFDDIQEVCDDCGAKLDQRTLADFIKDEN
jgi:DnaJ-class molecular chaperone